MALFRRSLLVIFIASMTITSLIVPPRVHATGSLRGPHTDSIQIDISPGGVGIEFQKLKGGSIDVFDDTFTSAQLADILGTDGSPPDSDIGLQKFKASDMFQIDLNNGCEATWGPVDAVWLGNSVKNATIPGGLGKTTFDTGAPRYCGYMIHAGADGQFGTRLNPSAGADDYLTAVPGYEGAIRKVPDTSEFPQGTKTNISPWTYNVQFRRALATLRNNVIDSICAAIQPVLCLDNPIPAGFVGDASSDLSNPSLNMRRWTGGETQADILLEALGLHNANIGTVRTDPVDNRCGGNMCPLIFYVRSDDFNRQTVGNLFTAEVTKVGIPVQQRSSARIIVRDESFRQFEYNMATGGWIFLFDKDYLYDLYTDTGILTSPLSTSLDYPLNTDASYKNCPGGGQQYNCASGGKFGSPNGGDGTGVSTAFLNTQARHAELAVTLPIFGDLGTSGFRKPYWVGSDQANPVATRGIVDAAGFGPMNYFSWFNAYQPPCPASPSCSPNSPYGGTLRVGSSSNLSDLNPITSEFVSETRIVSMIYDTLLVRDPYSLPTFRAWTGACTTASFSAVCFDTTTWSGTTPHGATGKGSLVHVRISAGADNLLNTDDDVRFQPHGALTLPGPDNVYGTVDDVAVPSTTGDCSISGFFCGKRLTGEDVEASLIYERDHGCFCDLVSDLVDVVVQDTPGLPAGNHLSVDVYYGVTTYLAEHWVGSITLVDSGIWGISDAGPDHIIGTGDDIHTPGRPEDDPIPNPFQFNARDPNGDGSPSDHVLYGTGAWKWNTGFDLSVGGFLPANRQYFTGARTPVDFDNTGDNDVTIGSEVITGVSVSDVVYAVAQFQFGLPYNSQRDINYDKKTDLDDYLSTLVYYQTGVVTMSDGVVYGGSQDALVFRAWPSMGIG